MGEESSQTFRFINQFEWQEPTRELVTDNDFLTLNSRSPKPPESNRFPRASVRGLRVR